MDGVALSELVVDVMCGDYMLFMIVEGIESFWECSILLLDNLLLVKFYVFGIWGFNVIY